MMKGGLDSSMPRVSVYELWMMNGMNDWDRDTTWNIDFEGQNHSIWFGKATGHM